MSPLTIAITTSGPPAVIARLRRALEVRGALNAAIAVDALELTQTYVAGIADHDTAKRLGAKPTNHLEKVANQIEAHSDDKQATLSIPRASRLRAAFGPYTVVPTGGRKFLTIPVAAESYGRGARTFGDSLKVVGGEKDGRKGLFLARKVTVKGDTPMSLLYQLVRKAEIKEDRRLLPFADIPDQAVASAGEFIQHLAKQGGDE